MVNCQKIVTELYKKCKRIVSELQHLRSLPEGAPRAITVRNGAVGVPYDYGAERCGVGAVRLRCGTEDGNRGWPGRNGRGQWSWGNHVTAFLNDKVDKNELKWLKS